MGEGGIIYSLGSRVIKNMEGQGIENGFEKGGSDSPVPQHCGCSCFFRLGGVSDPLGIGAGWEMQISAPNGSVSMLMKLNFPAEITGMMNSLEPFSVIPLHLPALIPFLSLPSPHCSSCPHPIAFPPQDTAATPGCCFSPL